MMHYLRCQDLEVDDNNDNYVTRRKEIGLQIQITRAITTLITPLRLIGACPLLEHSNIIRFDRIA